jgi:LPS sulfotransferase NodH
MIKFCILGIQRTGTTLIRTTLNSHPCIRCAGEVFKLKSWRSSAYEGELGYSKYINESLTRKIRHHVAKNSLAQEYLEFLYGVEGYEAIGFKLMHNQLKQFPQVVPYLKSNDVKVIHVIRENVLKTWVSRRAAVARGYHSTQAVGKIKMEIPTANLVKNLNRLSVDSQRWADIFSRTPNYISVCYEEFVNNRKRECGRLCGFLGVEAQEMESSLVKLTSDNLSDVIANYDEVRECLVGTPYEDFVVA